MKVYKNGICREIDQKREQEFREKGYTIEGVSNDDSVEILKVENEVLKTENETLKAENETLKTENEALKAENDTLKAHTDGEEYADTNGAVGETKTATRGKK